MHTLFADEIDVVRYHKILKLYLKDYLGVMDKIQAAKELKDIVALLS